MSRDKQIEEMVEVLRQNAESCKTCDWYKEGLCIQNCELSEDNQIVCEALYNAGYHKQSEWISVDKRLPQVCGTYICCVKDKYGNTWTIPADFSPEMKTWFGQFGEVKNTVTHWMPLPQPPKMRKEDEKNETH